MNELRLSTTTKTLLSAAKADVPSAAARAKMWTGVSGAIGGAAGVTGITASSLFGGGASVTKLLSLGALFGGTLTVGLAATLLYVGPAPAPSRSAILDPPALARGVVVRTDPPAVATPAAMPIVAVETPASPAIAVPPVPAPTKHTRAPSRSGKAGPAHEDSLGREASLVTQARGALGRGDPRAALRAVRAARALPSHQLDPEELAVEEQALRALGQSDEANGIEVQLRLQYPESDLAR